MTERKEIRAADIEDALNHAVATKIMGWTEIPGPVMVDGVVCQRAYMRIVGNVCEYVSELPKYISNSQLALQVAKEIDSKIEKKALHPSLQIHSLTLVYEAGESPWYASFHPHLPEDNSWLDDWWNYDYTCNSDSPAFAICRAAIEVIEEHQTLQKKSQTPG